MATNIQTFSGDIEVTSNLTVDTNTLHVDSVAGRVGMGTANPSKKLHVVTGGNEAVRFESGENPAIEFYNTQGGAGNEKNGLISYKHGNRTTDTDQALQFFNRSSSGSNIAFSFLTSGPTTRAVILDNGNVGIGTTNPTDILHIKRDVDENDSGVIVENLGSYSSSSIYVGRGNTDSLVLNFSRGVSSPMSVPDSFGHHGEIFTNANRSIVLGTNSTPRMTISNTGNVGIGIGTANPTKSLEINGSTFRYAYEYRYQDSWVSNNNQTFTIPVTGGSARGEMIVEAEVIQVASNSSAERMARVKGIITNYSTGNEYMTVFEGENATAFETYVVGTSGLASGTFTMKYQPLQGFQQSVVCRLKLKIWIGGFTSSLGSLTRTDAGSNSALTAPTLNSAPKIIGGNVGIGTANPSKKLHVVTGGNDPIRLESGVNPGIELYNTQGGAGNEKYCTITYKHGNRTTDADQSLQFFNMSSSGSNVAFSFLTSGSTTRAVILDNGNVGIGTASPTQKLDVNGNAYFGGTITYSNKQYTHDYYTSFTVTSIGNVKTVAITSSGVAHVHVSGLARLYDFTTTTTAGTSTNAMYFNLKRNSTPLTPSVGHRITYLGNANDVDQWRPIMLSWSGMVNSGDTIYFHCSACEGTISVNELRFNVLVV